MAWTANIITASKDSGRLALNVQFLDDAGSVPVLKDFYFDDPDPDKVKATLQAQIDALNKLDDAITNFPLGPIDTAPVLTEVPVPLPPAPLTPDQQARAQFASDLRTLRRMTNAIALGIKTSQDADYVAQLATVQKQFQNGAYLDLL